MQIRRSDIRDIRLRNFETYGIFKRNKTKASRALRFTIKHDNAIYQLSKLFEELLKLVGRDCVEQRATGEWSMSADSKSI